MRWFYLIFAFLYSCNANVSVSSEQDLAKQKDNGMDTTTMTLDTFQKNTKRPTGIYQVMLPCTDCKGIEHTVLFQPDLTFRLEENRLGKRNGFHKVEGRWIATEGKLFLYKNDTVTSRYTWQGDTLFYLQPDDHAIAMRRLSQAFEIPGLQQKGKAGVEFYGAGTEPFWSVEVDEQKSISFHSADSKPIKFKAVLPVITGDSSVYFTSQDSATLRITIFNAFCSDGMSDNIYDQKVRINYKGQVYNGCGIRYRP